MNLFKNTMANALIKFKIFICILFVFFNTILFASHEKGSSRLNLSQYVINTNNSVFLQDDKYAIVNSNLSNPSAFGFFDHTYKNKLVFGVDRTITSLGAISSNLTNNVFKAEIDVKVNYNKLVPSGSGFIFSGITVIKTLTVSFSGFDAHLNSSAPTSEIDIDAFNFEKGYQTLVNITAVRIYNTTNPTTPIANNNIPANIFLELQYDAERYHNLNTSAALPYANSTDFQLQYITGSTTGNEIELKWSRIVGAEEYDLEWLWLDEFTYGTPTFPANASWLSSAELNFKNNATRVRTDQNTYRVSNIYESGHLFFRIRGVGRSKTPGTLIALGNPIISDCFTNWTWPDVQVIANTAPVGATGGGLYGIASLPHFIDLRNFPHEQNKNWVYTGTYAEEGKKQEVVSYFDGSQHSRQTVTKNNSDNKAIVAETYYDFIGRPTMQAMPTPVDDATLKFYQETAGGQTAFNFDNSGTPLAFTKDAFAISIPATPCVANNSGLNNDYGTGKYYSGNNPFQAANYYNGYTPNGEKFPFTQTEYTPDNTGKIARQSGVGAVMKIENGIGVDKHDSRYLYGSVTQEELDQLFGSEAGYSKHYTKNVVVDPNGQVSISYLNQEGKVVATALSGQKPNNLQPLLAADGIIDLSTSSTPFQVDLLNKLNAFDTDTPKDNNELRGDELSFNEKIIVTSQQNYSFDYSALGANYMPCGDEVDICYDCIYDLEFDIRDKCNNRPAGFNGVTYTLGKIIGTPPTHTNPAPSFDQNCGNDQLNFSFQQIVAAPATSLIVLLDIGEYTITKKLKVNQAAIQAYLKDYLANCPTTPAAFDAAEANNLDASGCEMDCAECVAALGTLTLYISNNPNLTTQQATDQYNEMVKDCVEPCQYDSYCEITKETMLVDMSPSGQYAEFAGFGASFTAATFPVSIFNYTNSLPRGTTTVPTWTTPVHYITGAQEYLNENGAQDYVSVVQIAPNVYNPPVMNNPPGGAIIAGTGINQFLVKPQYLLNASDFVANFKPSWAQSLLKYHPEYCYIEWCLKNSFPVTGLSNISFTNVTYNALNVPNGISAVTFPPTSDNYDSLLYSIDDLDDIDPTSIISFDNIFKPLAKDPYWQTDLSGTGNGYYYVASVTGNPNNLLPNPAAMIATSGTIKQMQSTTSASPADFTSSAPNSMYFNESSYKTANNRFFNYKGTGLSLYQYAALLATPLAGQYNQPMNTLLTSLESVNYYPNTTFPLSNPADYILKIKKPNSVPSDDSYKRKAWENFRSLYLAMKQEMQQEAAQSYVMNGGCRGCNDCIGKANFDENTVKYTTYANFAIPFLLINPNTPFPANWASYVLSIISLNEKNWFNYNFPATAPNNRDQSCGLATKELFKNKIKRFSKSEDALALIGNANNTQATIYSQTGLCPNAYDLQNFLNAMFSGPKTIYTVTANNLNLNVPEFSQNLYQSILPVIPPTNFQNAMYTFISATSALNTLNGNIQINGANICNLQLYFPTSAAPMNQWSNYSGATPTFTINQLGGLTPTSNYAFNIVATISTGLIGNVTTQTVMLTGNTTCIQLMGCNFTPPCKVNSTGNALNAMLNVFSANGSFPAPYNGNYTTGLLTPTGSSPFKTVFVNSFKPLLENVSSTGWQWTYTIGNSELLISDNANATANKQLKIAFNTPFSFSPSGPPSISCIQSFQNFRPDPGANNPGAFIADGIIANAANLISCPSGTFTVRGIVQIGSYTGSSYAFTPLEIGRCSFDLTTCNTKEHEAKRDLEKWVISPASGFASMVTSTSAQHISSNTFFTSLLRSYLNSAVTYNSNVPQQNYYHWLPDAANTNNNQLGGWVTVTQSQTAPATAPNGSCYFTFKKKVAGGTSISSLLNAMGSAFVLATSPYLNNNVYTFKLSPGTTSDSLICSTTCFPLRACSSCTTTTSVYPPALTGPVIPIEDFSYSNTTPNYQLTNNNYGAYNWFVLPSPMPPLFTAPWSNYAYNYLGGTIYVPALIYYHFPGYTPNYSVPCDGQDHTINYGSSGGPSQLAFTPGAQGAASYYNGNSAGYATWASGANFFYPPNHNTTFTKNFQVTTTGLYVINFPKVQFQDANCKFYFNNVLVNSVNPTNISNVCNIYNYTDISNNFQYTINLIAGQQNQIKIVWEHFQGHAASPIEVYPITAQMVTPGSQNLIPCANSPWPTDTMPTAMYEEPCAPYLQDLIDNTADEKYDAYIDSTKTIFIRNYIKHCMSSVIENLAVKYNNTDYHYTLYYYDQAGNLSRTVPPQGVKPVNLTGIYSGGQTNGQAIKQDRDSYYNVGYVKKVYTQHKFLTTYTYNSLNQLVKQETPDAGISKFYYDNLGRLVASQNAEQKFQSTTAPVNEQKYSFTKYDALGRISMVGIFATYDLDALSPVIPNGQTVRDALSFPGYPLNLNTVFGNIKEVTQTYYGDDVAFAPIIPASNFSNGYQDNLRTRVASVSVESVWDGQPATYDHATHYSYDIHGNVKELIQDNPEMGRFTNQRYKRIQYTYDLISGKVNTVVYQRGQRDMFAHSYLYDAANRITNVYTSRDSMLWSQEAKYFYYLHGPLARVEMGEHKVQSLDYAYTLQGWIKGVNSEGLKADYDIGKDGYSVLTGASNGYNLNRFNARDGFGYTLGYYKVTGTTSYNDYLPVNGFNGTPTTYFIGTENLGASSLFNGNIMGMSTSYLNPSPVSISSAALDISGPSIAKYDPYCFQRRFAYDQLNRIKTAEVVGRNIDASNIWINSGAPTSKFYENFNYDQNGNITKLGRKSNVGNMDDLTYLYYDTQGVPFNPQTTNPSFGGTNKLAQVIDAYGASTMGDIGIQNSYNYTYDKIGNLKTDVAENISAIDWTVYGKIKNISTSNMAGVNLSFKYDASGNRVTKLASDFMGGSTATYYVRDAQGNIMATYRKDQITETVYLQPSIVTEDLFLSELDIYGSSRLGMLNSNDYIGAIVNNVNQPIAALTLENRRILGTRSYELSNHLGNVVAVVSDRKLAVSTAGNPNLASYFVPDIVSANDYYAFGSQMPGRNYTSSNYRYGFNGKENDNEVKGAGNQQDYGMRIYDPRLGKFLSVDPLTRKYPGLTSYQFASNSPIWMIDIDGLEGNPYSGDVPELPADGGRYGKRGIDWGVVANPAGEVPIAKSNNGIGPEGKYYWSPTTDAIGKLIWQKSVKVVTYKDVEEVQWEKVIEVSPAIPPTDPTIKTDHKTLDASAATYGMSPQVVSDFTKNMTSPVINAEKGKITGLILIVENDNPINEQIQATLQKNFGVPVTIQSSSGPLPASSGLSNPDYNIDVKYDVNKIIPGKPGKSEIKTEKWVKKTVTRKVATEEVKQ